MNTQRTTITPTITSLATTAPAERTAAPARTPIRRIVARGVVAGVAGSAAAVAVALVATGVGVSLLVQGEPIPPVGFGTLTLMFSVVGIAIAIVCDRRSSRPQRSFERITVLLTIVSLVFPLLLDTDAGTKITLELAHVVAAAVIIPLLAARLPHARRA